MATPPTAPPTIMSVSEESLTGDGLVVVVVVVVIVGVVLAVVEGSDSSGSWRFFKHVLATAAFTPAKVARMVRYVNWIFMVSSGLYVSVTTASAGKSHAPSVGCKQKRYYLVATSRKCTSDPIYINAADPDPANYGLRGRAATAARTTYP